MAIQWKLVSLICLIFLKSRNESVSQSVRLSVVGAKDSGRHPTATALPNCVFIFAFRFTVAAKMGTKQMIHIDAFSITANILVYYVSTVHTLLCRASKQIKSIIMRQNVEQYFTLGKREMIKSFIHSFTRLAVHAYFAFFSDLI